MRSKAGTGFLKNRNTRMKRIRFDEYRISLYFPLPQTALLMFPDSVKYKQIQMAQWAMKRPIFCFASGFICEAWRQPIQFWTCQTGHHGQLAKTPILRDENKISEYSWFHASAISCNEIMWNANRMLLGTLLMYLQLDMFRVHIAIIRSIRCSVTAYGFLHRVFG